MAKKKLKWPFSEERKHYLTAACTFVANSRAKLFSRASTKRNADPSIFVHGSFLRSAINQDSYHYRHQCWDILSNRNEKHVCDYPEVGVLDLNTTYMKYRSYSQMEVKAEPFACIELTLQHGFTGEPIQRGDLPCCKLT